MRPARPNQLGDQHDWDGWLNRLVEEATVRKVADIRAYLIAEISRAMSHCEGSDAVNVPASPCLLSELGRGGLLVVLEVSALQPVDVRLCFVDVLAQGGCFEPDASLFQPGQLAGHFVQYFAQSPDQLHGL